MLRTLLAILRRNSLASLVAGTAIFENDCADGDDEDDELCSGTFQCRKAVTAFPNISGAMESEIFTLTQPMKPIVHPVSQV